MQRVGGIAMAWAGLGLIVVGIALSAWAIDGLADGVREIPQHWWSSLAVLPLLAGLALTMAGLLRASRPGA